jgi:DNA-binding transcriptional MerR regulator
MRVGEVASRAGVNVETLRYYERRGLLPAPDRAPSGHRVYDEETVRFLRAIKEAQAVGFTLAEIAEYLGAARRGTSPSEELRVRMAAKIDEIDLRIGGLQRMRGELARVIGCACTSLDHCTCGAGYLARAGKEPAMKPTLLHVTNGESAGNTLRRTAIGGAVLPWQDSLHEGPLPPGPRAEFLRARASFLSECGWGTRAAILASLERRDAQYLGALRDGAHVVLWFEHDLYDQLQLLDALALARTVGRTPELVQAGEFLGAMHEPELEALWETRRAVDAGTVAHSAEIWDLVRGGEVPDADLPALPYLGAALRRLREERPADGGISRTARQALRAIADGARHPLEAFVASQRMEEAPFLGDTWFFRTLAGLEGLIEPLPVPPPLGDARAFAQAELRLTADGERASVPD